MARIERSIVISKPWQSVDAVALDGGRIAEWFVGVEKSTPDSSFPNVGGVVNMLYKAAGMTFDMTQKTLEYEPGNYILFQVDGAMINGTQRWTHKPEGAGTRLTAVFDYETQGGGVGKILDRLLLERMNTEQLEKSLSNLKAVVEG